MTHHTRPFVEIHSDGTEPVEEQWYEQDCDLYKADPVGEEGPVVTCVSAEFPFPRGFWHVANQASFPQNFPNQAHSMLPPENSEFH